jgi:hypothetical protein
MFSLEIKCKLQVERKSVERTVERTVETGGCIYRRVHRGLLQRVSRL